MPTSNDPRQRALEAMRRFIGRVEPRHVKVRAIVGDGAGNVAVTGWPNYYWVRIVGKTEMPSQAYCDSMIPGNGMHVYVEEERKSGQVKYTILGRPDSQGWFTGDREATGAGSPTPEHHVVHETGGSDMINVGPYMIENLRGGPTSPASMSVRISWAPNVTFGRTSVPFPDATSQYKDSAVLTVPTWGERFDMISVDEDLDINVLQGTMAWTGATKPACPNNELPVCWALVRSGDTSLDGTRFWPANSLHTTGILHAAEHETGGADEINIAAMGGHIYQTFLFTFDGPVEVGNLKFRIYIRGTYIIDKVRAAVATTPAITHCIVDVHKNGVTIFTDQGKRPEIEEGNYYDDSPTPDVTALADGDYIEVEVDQADGAYLSVHVYTKQAVW